MEISHQIEKAIAALETQRAVLGDEVVETALKALRENQRDLIHPAVSIPDEQAGGLEEHVSEPDVEFRLWKNAYTYIHTRNAARGTSDKAQTKQLSSVLNDTQRRMQNLASLHAMQLAINNSLDQSQTLSILLDELFAHVKVNAAAVLLRNPRSHELECVASRGFNGQDYWFHRPKLCDEFCSQAILEKRITFTMNLASLEHEFYRLDVNECVNYESYYALPLEARGRVRGALELFFCQRVEPEEEWMDFLEAVAEQAAIAIDNATSFSELQRSMLEVALADDNTLEAWARAIELRDHHVAGHSRRVAELTLTLAKALDVPESEWIHIWRGAILHDVGIMAIPDSVLLKAGPLTEEEMKILRMHPVYGYEILAPIHFLVPASTLPRYHHERWDGKGYPYRLKGEQIPLAARIFAVADVWDALIFDRPYRKAWPEKKAVEYIRKQSEKHFDPKVVDMFLKLVG